MWCPEPEAAWGIKAKGTMSLLHKCTQHVLEPLLYYTWHSCATILKDMQERRAYEIRCLVAIKAADVILTESQATVARTVNTVPGMEARMLVIRTTVLQQTVKWFREIQEATEKELPTPRAEDKWITFSSVEEKKPAEPKSTPEKTMIMPRVVAYDSEGKPLGCQEQRSLEASTAVASAAMEVPFQSWLGSDLGRELGEDVAAQSAIVRVLHGIHISRAATEYPVRIDFYPATGRTRVVATTDIPEGGLKLAPCCPKATKFPKESTHADKVRVRVRRNTPTALAQPNCSTFYIGHAWRLPTFPRASLWWGFRGRMGCHQQDA